MAGIIAHDAPVRASDVQAQPRAQRNRQFHQLSRRIANISVQGQRLGYSDACQLAAMPVLLATMLLLQRLHKKIHKHGASQPVLATTATTEGGDNNDVDDGEGKWARTGKGKEGTRMQTHRYP